MLTNFFCPGPAHLSTRSPTMFAAILPRSTQHNGPPQYKASITVPDCPGPERMLTLSSDLDTICNIVNDVVPNLEENGGRANGGELDLRMMIHQSQAGCVIGKGGVKIKEIRDKTGARIKIFSNCAPQSTDRVIQIVGQPNKCIETIREVLTLIKSSPVKGPVTPYDPHNFDDFYAEEYGGYGSAQGGENRRGAGGAPPPRPGGGPRTSGERNDGRFNNRGPPPQRTGGPMGGSFSDRPMSSGPPSRGSFGGGGPTRGLNGGPSPFGRDNAWSGPMSQPSNIIPSGMGGNQAPPPHMGGGGLGNGSGGPGKSSTQVTIPKDLAGAIIGKGGGRIRKIRQDSGAGITIDEPLPGSNDRIITITGSPNQIQMAQYLLQQSVHNNSERGGY